MENSMRENRKEYCYTSRAWVSAVFDEKKIRFRMPGMYPIKTFFLQNRFNAHAHKSIFIQYNDNILLNEI